MFRQLLSSLGVASLLACGLLLGGCSRDGEPSRKVAELASSEELVVVTRNGPTTLYVNAEGQYAGFEYDLASAFADFLGKKLKLVIMPRDVELLDKVRQHEAHLALGVLANRKDPDVQYGPTYLLTQAVVVGHADDSSPPDVRRLRTDGVLLASGQYARLVNELHKDYPQINWNVTHLEHEELIEKVSNRLIDYALVDTHSAEVVQNYYPQAKTLFTVGARQQLAWAYDPAENPDLDALLSKFFARIGKDGRLKQLVDRYFGHVNRLQPLDSETFLNRRISLLPKYRKYFQEAEEKYGIDWRLLAALAYQESHWDPNATSAYGVRGLMMLTNETADNMGVENRLDPRQSVMGGAKLLALLKGRLPAQIEDPDRTWIALAGYNIGLAHLADARSLAARLKRNPNVWADVKETLVLLRNPDYFATLNYGYARGGETVIFVENLRTYYDILVRFEKPYKPLLPSFQEGVTVSNPENVPLDINARYRLMPNQVTSVSK